MTSLDLIFFGYFYKANLIWKLMQKDKCPLSNRLLGDIYEMRNY